MKTITFFWIVGTSVALILIAVIGVYLNSGFINGTFTIEPSISSYFGTFLNSLLSVFLSTLTVVLIWLTYKSQKRELEETKKVLGKQQFESILFKLIDNHRKLKDSIVIYDASLMCNNDSTKNERHEGVRAFEVIRYDFLKYYKYRVGVNPDQSLRTKPEETFYQRIAEDYTITKEDYSKESSVHIYNEYFSKVGKIYGHYFRNAYHILKYISEHADGNDRFVYSDFFQSELSEHELFMHFYNGLAFNKMHGFLDELNFLENLAESTLIESSVHKSFYKTKFK
ncbi:putative phage abortive infection protein [Rhodohalobacter sp. 614A]|uniref:putative phage abortive infection protein n=1 Tax=Rhodohalobacter sp. 614A TaxID=2908649 RepID=UPI001F416712|nr:putative phage abortive infection protein [Rhodohalobacter sp. 614A]